MKRILACLATLAFTAVAFGASAQAYDPIGDVIAAADQSAAENATDLNLKATLYHTGHNGMSQYDSLGCKVSPLRTVAVDPALVSRHTLLFIKETVGLPLPGGGVHDGYWYASDVGGAIKGAKIDLFSGHGAGSMQTLAALNLHTLTVSKAGQFTGCPPLDGGAGQVADAGR
jgi:3D (Asp-Asp-Asp) domain-containing protein